FLSLWTLLSTVVSTLPTTPQLGDGARETCLREAVQATECARAVLNFPTDPQIGFFHLDGADDVFRIPTAAYAGGCLVSVELARGVTTPMAASWPQIVGLVNTLTTACLYPRLGSVRTGGIIKFGSHNQLEVSLKQYKRSTLAQLGNSTRVLGNPTEVATE
ncbi:MAG: hypothetical protein Q9224_002507, partial [Gallowayella concinna]